MPESVLFVRHNPVFDGVESQKYCDIDETGKRAVSLVCVSTWAFQLVLLDFFNEVDNLRHNVYYRQRRSWSAMI